MQNRINNLIFVKKKKRLNKSIISNKKMFKNISKSKEFNKKMSYMIQEKKKKVGDFYCYFIEIVSQNINSSKKKFNNEQSIQFFINPTN